MSKADKNDESDSKPKKQRWTGASEIAKNSSDRYVPAYEKIVEAPQRIVLASAALQKRGKTRFAFTAPKPLAYLQLDGNYEHVLAWGRKKYGKDAIRHIKYFADPRGDIRAANAAVFERLIKDFDYCVDNFRAVVVDTTTELLDVRKLAEYGRNTQILQVYYGSIYADLRWMVKRALDSNANVIFVHRLKDEWKDGDRTGAYVMDGWRGIQFEVQVYVEHQRDEEGKFVTNVLECAQDANLMGMTLASDDDENDFKTLASRIYPSSEPEDWE